jgi:prepilin-type N-terminal cleavage/methylation domain-containing protein
VIAVRRPAGDGGFSLTEILVAMSITALIGAVFTTAILQLYKTAGAEDNDFATQSQTSQALLRLEKQVRYAYSIGTVHAEGATAMPYVEFLVMVQPVATSPEMIKRCMQLRLNGTQLQSRYWTQGSAGTVTAWMPLADNLSTAGAVPFARTQPTAAVNHQLLTVRLAGRSGTAVKTSAITFTALNTYASTALDTAGNPIAATAEPCYDTSTRS